MLRKLLPDWIRMRITGFFYGWHGNYPSWEDAKKRSRGYDSEEIIRKVSSSAAAVRDGLKPYERDSVLYSEIQYSFQLLSILMLVAAQRKGTLNVMDFGGALGSTYFQNKKFLDTLQEVNWSIVEQPRFTEIGIREFSTDRLHFFNTADDCYNSFTPDIILLSSVLQYIEEPYKLLDSLISRKPEYILFDRTPFINGKDRITIQKVHPAIYNATYPCWFFNKSKFLDFMNRSYKLIFEFDALDKANISSEFLGFLFRIK
ncbi:MAG: methyltransferase, TIGR04325 family [Bacteroidales bacterium]|jgi:putative methyltransferase (TIGR04325 family)|nr:methyltransferase, TIGR04325 family [Bacteroidales bacterium]